MHGPPSKRPAHIPLYLPDPESARLFSAPLLKFRLQLPPAPRPPAPAPRAIRSSPPLPPDGASGILAPRRFTDLQPGGFDRIRQSAPASLPALRGHPPAPSSDLLSQQGGSWRDGQTDTGRRLRAVLSEGAAWARGAQPRAAPPHLCARPGGRSQLLSRPQFLCL